MRGVTLAIFGTLLYIISIYYIYSYSNRYSNHYVIDQELLADAIYNVEHSKEYPYGIVSIRTYGDEHYARYICLNTINNNLARWQLARQEGYKGDYIRFLAGRYCPLNRTAWERMVRHRYKEALLLDKGLESALIRK